MYLVINARVWLFMQMWMGVGGITEELLTSSLSGQVLLDQGTFVVADLFGIAPCSSIRWGELLRLHLSMVTHALYTYMFLDMYKALNQFHHALFLCK